MLTVLCDVSDLLHLWCSKLLSACRWARSGTLPVSTASVESVAQDRGLNTVARKHDWIGEFANILLIVHSKLIGHVYP